MEKIGLFKIPTEILTSLNVDYSVVYPANLYQFVFSYRHLKKIKPGKKLNTNYPYEKALEQYSSFRKVFPSFHTWNVKSEKRRLNNCYNWGLKMLNQGSTVIAWNKNDPQTIAMAASGVQVIYLENGFFRGRHLYCSRPDLINNIEINVKYSLLLQTVLNILDCFFDFFEANRTLFYYNQIIFKSINKIKNRLIGFVDLKNATDIPSADILFLGQLDYDANTIIHGKNYNSKSVLKILNSERCSFFYRPHPNIYVSKTEKKYMREINGLTLNEEIDNSNVILTINSSAAVMALMKNKLTLFLGGGDLPDLFPEYSVSIHDVLNNAIPQKICPAEVSCRLELFRQNSHLIIYKF